MSQIFVKTQQQTFGNEWLWSFQHQHQNGSQGLHNWSPVLAGNTNVVL
jgi:hypothetical protein